MTPCAAMFARTIRYIAGNVVVRHAISGFIQPPMRSAGRAAAIRDVTIDTAAAVLGAALSF